MRISSRFTCGLPTLRNAKTIDTVVTEARIMEKLTRNENTPGTDAAFDLLGKIAVDPNSDERYPDGTVLIPADSRDAPVLISKAIEDRRPVAVVLPDGSDIVVWPHRPI